MTVYVDDIRIPARVGRISARWSHLTVGPADDVEDLHEFAAKIGLSRAWFQDKPWPHAHYDVTDSKRQQAIRAGAVPVTWREAAEQRNKARLANVGMCCACGHQAHNGYNGQPCAECGNCVAIVISDRLDHVKPAEELPQLALFDIPSAGVTRTYRRRQPRTSVPVSGRSPQLALFALEEVL